MDLKKRIENEAIQIGKNLCLSDLEELIKQLFVSSIHENYYFPKIELII